MRILSVVGARPQFVKLAPIASAMEGRAEHLIAHTGQHYDEIMSDVFFEDLGIPAPDFNLGVGSGKHGRQTGTMLAGLEDIFESVRPDCVLVYGDTNSTLAAALAAVKMHIPLAHLEAGLRSFNRRMPEEHNRVLTDHASDILLAPTEVAMQHLANEGLAARSVLVGDVMTDVLYKTRSVLEHRDALLPSGVTPGDYYISTIHRPDNTDDPARLKQIIESLSDLDRDVVLLAHPRLVDIATRHGLSLDSRRLKVANPLAYPELVNAVMNSAGVITDSGGLQKEAFLLRVPCTTIRPETEWVETVNLGWNVLVSDDLSVLAAAVQRPAPAPTTESPYGDGQAARRTVDALLEAGADSGY
ncbi:non-hydrolyzing UDP-N-acetylglucosamine 2-epimerase [Pseudarthrobacter sulfonivorans]|uniref:non-hydrolyzing UDP-N-acetylglucosamine 2-epimerase n=1 Tax=Pseudarthrobacter sulfonivorans TaxID=121292 RepID=UPI0028679658|nr:UDP-N-acetylglucosamine 2-epimerase (non-hydrolyzing) [Pseudarthrobacter sulfonivorans]MDR6413840.1 UDP-N-acetylglucosamine 2-epimerase (non-hydrolyzing) [Pseudarthrobacter sulfonivorans]